MQRIGIRELRQHASRYLAQVKAGQTIEVGERGRLIALLVPPASEAASRDRLVASGQLLPARVPFAPPRRRLVVGDGQRHALEELEDLRRERLT